MTNIDLCSPNITELAGAMLKVQQALKPAHKDGQNNFTNSKYASLLSVMDSCREALLANGIWMTQLPVNVDSGNLGLISKIVHAESGQWQASLLVMPLPKSDPQGYGSAMTYARRYGLSALIGIVTEHDDDAEGSCRPQNENGGYNPDRHLGSRVTELCQKQLPDDGATSFNLPRLEGIQYSKETARDGNLCILATGNTHSQKDLLRKAGFRWDGNRKLWWKYEHAA
ncbi:ERF family protein [Maridesulfovibrio ferrireducens]|uniref:ERF family protein n=1 Tax=Maridesulfovibrio ferrireducens TaxID=246191 RepID=UPI001A1C7DF6|nr:ERF family protein [Maridesulfovibrio ferrireducens]MBI9113315.1 ERF family protein [Maridesulfovibrio ferrireducens]